MRRIAIATLVLVGCRASRPAVEEPSPRVIECAEGPNACTIELSSEPMISCQCGETGGFAMTGDASLRGRGEAELVAICQQHSRECEPS
ncbi:MAG TPA: hypothetical protein VG755_17815 [Nannocystaceae bacterium]|nr:hypothetical protein [Nannocystaceae bacterium]